MKLLLTGANGQVGWELLQQLNNNKQFEFLARTHSELDITDQKQIELTLHQFKPDFLINAAAYTAVDKAEQDHELAYKVNAHGPFILAQICANNNIPLLHLSTDYIFAGKKQHPYKESDPASPLNVYGKTKWEGEEAIRENWSKHLILRVSGVFSQHGQNFVKTILRLAQEKSILKVVDDQILCPTPAVDIAKTILNLCKALSQQQHERWGIYHYCGKDAVSWHQFAKQIITIAKTKNLPLAIKQLRSIPSSDYPTPANRPLYSVLDCHKIQSHFSIAQPMWQDSLKQMIDELYP